MFNKVLKEFKKMDDWIKYLLVGLIFVIVLSLLWPRSSSPNVRLVPVSGTPYYKAVFEDFTDMEELLKSPEPVIAFYSQDWCGYCKNMKETWKKFQDEYKKCRIVQIDCGEHKELAKKQNIKGYPTIKYHKNGLSGDDAVVYKGDRTLQSLIQFAEKHN
jgi:thiol-disulfide isomerase/thioredoxin